MTYPMANSVVNSHSAGRNSGTGADTNGLWWSKDQAGHGGSVWKVFDESNPSSIDVR